MTKKILSLTDIEQIILMAWGDTIPFEVIAREYGLTNVVIVLNAFTDDALYSRYYSTNYATSSQSTYYYYSDYKGYSSSGYYIDDEKKSWWKIWKRFRK